MDQYQPKNTTAMKNEIIDILHKCTTGAISIDQGADQLERLFEDNQYGQQMTLFDQMKQEEIPLFKGTMDQLSEISIGLVENPDPGHEFHVLEKKIDESGFKGAGYYRPFDHERLKGQMLRIYQLMIDKQWRTLSEISDATGDPEASISAQLRGFRRPSFGSNTVNRRRRGEPKNGLWEYQLIINRNESE